MNSIFWFRNDLRLADNPALHHAVKDSDRVLFLYIYDDSVQPMLGGAQRWWLHHSLQALTDALRKKDVNLVLLSGKSESVLTKLVEQYQIESIYWNHSYEPKMQKRDSVIKKKFNDEGVTVKTYNGYLLTDPSKIYNKSGGFYKVYTPYWKHVNSLLKIRKQFSIPRKIVSINGVASEQLDSWGLLPIRHDWSDGLMTTWLVGERAAQKALKNFIDCHLENYASSRDRPDMKGTSLLSPYLHFGELGPWQVWNAVKQVQVHQPNLSADAIKMLQQLVWREFSYYLLTHFPDLDSKNFRPAFDNFRWSGTKKQLLAWQNGLTGYPIVDAGMRELWHTGYMHNRVRMVVASFLTKDLFIDWREGERWFWDTLVDADLANNAASWQWVAGCGADAAPYFRIFNPVLQGQKFDPNGDYVRQWIPELSSLPNKYVHQPWIAPEEILKKSKLILGENYPSPIVDHKKARDEAMRRYKEIK